MSDPKPDPSLAKAQAAAMELLRPKMQEKADAVIAAFFTRTDEYVGEDLGPLLSVAGIDPWEVQLAFVRMVVHRMFEHAFVSAWGPTKRERAVAMDFLRVTLGHMQATVGKTLGKPVEFPVMIGKGPGGGRVVRPGGR